MHSVVVVLLLLIGTSSASICRRCTATGPQTETVIVGEFTNWKYWTLNTAVGAVNASLYTHLLYKTPLDPTGARCSFTEDWLDRYQPFGNDTLDPYQGAFNQIRLLKIAHPHLKVLMSIGGYDHSGDLSLTAANATLRAQLVACSVSAMGQYGFDGLNLDWQYPATAGKSGNIYSASDRANLVALARDFRAGLGPAPLFTMSVAYWSSVLNVRYDLVALSAYVDWFNVNAFYFVGGSDSVIGHASNLYPAGSNLAPSSSVVSTINMALGLGIAACKIVVGLPAFGFEWHLARAPATASFPDLYGTGVSTHLATGAESTFYIDRDFATMTTANGWVEVWDATAQASALFNNASQLLVTYESARAAALKAQWVADNGLGGVLLEDINGDMMNNRLGSVLFSTLQASSPCHNYSLMTTTTVPSTVPPTTAAPTPARTPAPTPAPTPTKTPAKTVSSKPSTKPSSSAPAKVTGSSAATTPGPLLQDTSNAFSLDWKVAVIVAVVASLVL